MDWTSWDPGNVLFLWGYTCSFLTLPSHSWGSAFLWLVLAELHLLGSSYTESPTTESIWLQASWTSLKVTGTKITLPSHRHSRSPQCLHTFLDCQESIECQRLGLGRTRSNPGYAVNWLWNKGKSLNSLGLIFITCVMRTFCVNYTFYFEIITDLHAVGRNDTEGSHFPFSQFSL